MWKGIKKKVTNDKYREKQEKIENLKKKINK